MSEFSRELQATAEFHFPESIDSFYKNIPLEWVSEAVDQTGLATKKIWMSCLLLGFILYGIFNADR